MGEEIREKCISCQREMAIMIQCNICKHWVCKECEQIGLCQRCYASLPRTVIFVLQAVYDKHQVSFFDADIENKKSDHSFGNESQFVPDRLSGFF
jgi:hypothetical protein